MTESLAWLVFYVGSCSIATSGIIVLGSSKDAVPVVAGLCITAAVWLAMSAKEGRVKTFTDVFSAVGLVLAALKFTYDRHKEEAAKLQEERAKRNDRLIAEWQAFVSNKRFVKTIYLLEVDDIKLMRLGTFIPEAEYLDWKNPLDQLFDFLQRLAYAVEYRHMEITAVAEAVGWYYRRVYELEHVREYCNEHGYKAVVNLALRIIELKRTGVIPP